MHRQNKTDAYGPIHPTFSDTKMLNGVAGARDAGKPPTDSLRAEGRRSRTMLCVMCHWHPGQQPVDHIGG
jgi:hypothetical protein